MSVEAATSATAASNVFVGDGPAANANQPIDRRLREGVSTNLRRPFFAGGVANAQGFGGAFGWTQGIDYFCNCATNRYNSLQTKAHQAVLAGLLAVHRSTRCSTRSTTTATTSSSIRT